MDGVAAPRGAGRRDYCRPAARTSVSLPLASGVASLSAWMMLGPGVGAPVFSLCGSATGAPGRHRQAARQAHRPACAGSSASRFFCKAATWRPTSYPDVRLLGASQTALLGNAISGLMKSTLTFSVRRVASRARVLKIEARPFSRSYVPRKHSPRAVRRSASGKYMLVDARAS